MPDVEDGPTRDAEQRELPLAELDVEGGRVRVALAVAHDGVEWVGHLRFTGEVVPGAMVTDHAAIPGRTVDAALAYAGRLTPAELLARYERAVAERRRFHPLRRATTDLLGRIRHINRVATSMRVGLMRPDEGAREIAKTQHELHELVSTLIAVAGVEDDATGPGAA